MNLFDNMMAQGIKPDVVSCTALITALAADGQWQRAEGLVDWMLRSGTHLFACAMHKFKTCLVVDCMAPEWAMPLLQE